MSNAGVRARRLRQLVVEERRTIASMLAKAEQRLKATEWAAEAQRKDREMFRRRMEAFDERLKKLDEWRNEPVVLVRTSAGGYGLPVYHDARQYCGYVWDKSTFKSMLLAEAEEAGHRPCSACGWRAKKRRLPAAA